MDLTLKSLEIVYLENGASVKGLADKNEHRLKVVPIFESHIRFIPRVISLGVEKLKTHIPLLLISSLPI